MVTIPGEVTGIDGCSGAGAVSHPRRSRSRVKRAFSSRSRCSSLDKAITSGRTVEPRAHSPHSHKHSPSATMSGGRQEDPSKTPETAPTAARHLRLSNPEADPRSPDRICAVEHLPSVVLTSTAVALIENITTAQLASPRKRSRPGEAPRSPSGQLAAAPATAAPPGPLWDCVTAPTVEQSGTDEPVMVATIVRRGSEGVCALACRPWC